MMLVRIGIVMESAGTIERSNHASVSELVRIPLDSGRRDGRQHAAHAAQQLVGRK